MFNFFKKALLNVHGKQPFYITTTLPYVNSDPHVGFGMEIVRADIIARYQKLVGREVFFNTGTDEHGIKIYRKAQENGKSPQEYVDEYAEKFKKLMPVLNISNDVNFIRTTDDHHMRAAQEFWKICDKNGDIYKKNYKVKYCVGCELEKTESELVDGRCPIHPNTELEIIEEENYFFRFSKYQKPLLDLYKKNSKLVIPQGRMGEIRAFVERGLEDFSISRLASKMPWGIPVPGDEKQVMYVWFDALVNYISAVGWPTDMAKFQKWWVESGGVVQYCGKDNLRQQSAMWQAMLMSAGLTPSQTIVIDGFITSGGKKMSKSEGNVINPVAVVEEFGVESFRYFVARELHPFEDSDFTMDKFKDAYNSHLANGLGNLVSRIMKMAEKNLPGPVSLPKSDLPNDFKKALEEFDIKKAADIIWERVGKLDARIQTTEPFKLIKTDEQKAISIIKELVIELYAIGKMLAPIMPETSDTIRELVRGNKTPSAPIFLRR
ncbi:MAG TPA: methionine--tRNA ligase [Candidatus Nanoarchaeia archaeon]|nr:methionine--tRNA ligase [Candidatus Nanoarchaeia archaeon]